MPAVNDGPHTVPTELARKIAQEVKAVMAAGDGERWTQLLSDVKVLRSQMDDMRLWTQAHQASDAAEHTRLQAGIADARSFKDNWKGALALAVGSLALLIWGLNRMIPAAPAKPLSSTQSPLQTVPGGVLSAQTAKD